VFLIGKLRIRFSHFWQSRGHKWGVFFDKTWSNYSTAMNIDSVIERCRNIFFEKKLKKKIYGVGAPAV
jgi:hypothetical protein